MLELKTCYTLSQVPYVTYDVLEDYAMNIVHDFAPGLLYNPAPVDTDTFLEFYLRLNVDFRLLCYNKKILGITAFNDGTVEIMDEETGQAVQLPVTEGTVIRVESKTEMLITFSYQAEYENALALLRKGAA